MKHKATRLISTLLTTSLLLTSMAAAETLIRKKDQLNE